ncbi:hypothetical protein OMR58_12000 [Erwinia sp. INIA-01]|nr:hypothetical protein [Erwinia sp. INIA01]
MNREETHCDVVKF